MSTAVNDAGPTASTWRPSSAPIDPAAPVIKTRLPASTAAQAATSRWISGRVSNSSTSMERAAANRSAALPTAASSGPMMATRCGSRHGSRRTTSLIVRTTTSDSAVATRNGATGRRASADPGLRNRFITSPTPIWRAAASTSQGSSRCA